jgi:bifunctional DNase/RNase
MTTDIGIGFAEMRVSKVVGLTQGEDDLVQYVVLDEVSGDRHLLIAIGEMEALNLAASLNGMAWPRPMTYQFMAALVRGIAARRRSAWFRKVLDISRVSP